LWTCRIPQRATNAEYEQAMLDSVGAMRREGIESIAFGDLFLSDVRAYRERLMARSGVQPLFPLWGKPTSRLAREFVQCGFKAVLVCVDPRQLDVSHCGSEYDSGFLAALSGTADPCGENGEFHTFVYDAPMFSRPIAIQRGVVVERDGFVFCDLLPGDPGGATSW
jgi:uncharacterized protein (TIGR00290 family)